MREFKTRPVIFSLRWETKFLYTLFLLFCAINYLLMGVMGSLRAGWAGGEVANYFAGNAAGGVEEVFPKTFSELSELTHFHLFSISIFLLVKCHIFLLCAWPRRAKGLVCVLSFVTALIYMMIPWIVRFVPDARIMVAWLFGPSRIVLLACLLVMLLVPIQQMWFSRETST